MLDRVLRAEMAAIRKRLRGVPINYRKSTTEQRKRDRFARRKTRQVMKGIRKKPRPQLPKYLMVTRYRPSPLLTGLHPHREKMWTPMLRRPVMKSAPALALKNFSFLDNPNAALADLKRIAFLECEVTAAHLHFEDEYCQDAGAYLVLAQIWPEMANIFRGGQMKRPVQKVLDAIGVGHHNNMTLMAAERDKGADGKYADVWAFPLVRRRPALSSKSQTVHIEPQTRERAADRFCETVNEWIGVPEIDLELTQTGKGWVAGIIGELLCNAERHSQKNSSDGDWSVTAFMVKRTVDGVDLFRCFMAFLSVGQSFAQSLDTASQDVRKFVDEYVAKHWRAPQSPETLATLVALQDTVTCDPSARSQKSGGTGLMDVLDFVDALTQSSELHREARVTIVSGKSCIQLQGPYMRGERKYGPESPRALWCNEENSHDTPPDPMAVFDLEEHFAGTLVSVAFTLDPVYLAGDSEKDDGDD